MRLLALAILVSGVAGCGTLANLEGKRYAFLSLPNQKPVRVYGGVRNDFDWVAEGVGFPESRHTRQDDSVRRQPQPPLENRESDDQQPRWHNRHPASPLENPIGVALGLPMFGYFAIVDPMLSFVGDTVTLPHVLKKISTAEAVQGSNKASPMSSEGAAGGSGQPASGYSNESGGSGGL
jgi:hypothetical protein